MHTCQTIFLYEYLGLMEQKRDTVQGMMNYIWAQQDSGDGAFASFPGGPKHVGISIQAYLAAKMAGEDERSERMQKLEKYIRSHRKDDEASIALPWLMIFEVDPKVHCISSVAEPILMKMEKSLPWFRIMLLPMVHLFSSGNTHRLAPEKFPKRLGSFGPGCPAGLPDPLRALKPGQKEFKKWLLANMGEDGTLFDYAPTSVPALMALSNFGDAYSAKVKRGIESIERFHVTEGNQIHQSPGESSIGETYMVLHALLDMGLTHENPMLDKAEKFLWSMQMPDTGAFGFSKNAKHFPDADDTSNAVYVLKRMADLRGTKETDALLEKAMRWVLTIQNPDGGFGTWERDPAPLLSKLMAPILKGRRMDLAISGAEQSARITLALSLFKDRSPEFNAAYHRAMKWLLKQQGPDGSYKGIWMVNYLFCTATALTTFGTNGNDPAVHAGIERAIQFILKHQQADGGFSESPLSYNQEKVVYLPESSPAITGLVVSQLLMFLKEEGNQHWNVLQPSIDKAVAYLVRTQKEDGVWHDPAWTGVTFPKLEYLIYPYIQEIQPLQAVGLYRQALRRVGQ